MVRSRSSFFLLPLLFPLLATELAREDALDGAWEDCLELVLDLDMGTLECTSELVLLQGEAPINKQTVLIILLLHPSRHYLL